MAVPLTAVDAVRRVRNRIEDPAANEFSDSEVLEFLDEALHSLWIETLATGDNHELDLLQIPVASLTNVNTNEHEYTLPEYLAEVRGVEGAKAGRLSVEEIPRAPLTLRTQIIGPSYVWRSSRPGTLRIAGRITGFTTINVWYIRRWGPLHYADSPQTGLALDDQIQFSASPTGAVVRRNDLYVGMDVQVTADFPSGTKDQVRRITGYTGNTQIAQLASAWPAGALTGQSSYSLVVPLAPEHTSLLLSETAYLMAEELGMEGQIALMLPRLSRLRSAFKVSVSNRDNTPKRVWNYGM